jgi:hypothetical protein
LVTVYIRCYLLSAAAALSICTAALAAPPSDSLMSANARGFVSVPNLKTLQDNWHRSQMGQLVADEAMQPFVNDMRRQIERKLNGAREKLGLKVDDIKQVAAGEIGIALVERKNSRAAVAITVDVTGRKADADALLGRIDAELTKRGGKRTDASASGVAIVSYQIPPQGENDVQREAAFFIHQDVLVACDNRLEAEEMIARFNGAGDRLADVKAYQETMQQCAAEAGQLGPDVRWFVDPFGYARATRSMLKAKPADNRGADYVKILESQGFDAIQGIGGFINIEVQGTFELLHRTAVYAPAVSSEPNKYRLAMQIMQFPNGENLQPAQWLPRKLASYRTFNCDLQNAYDHVGSLVDAVSGYENTFRDMIDGLETDPYGARIKVKEEFINHLGSRVTLMTDYEVPITTKSERFMFVVDLKNEKAMQATIRKYMLADPNAHEREFEGLTIWEVQPPESDIPELDLPAEPVGDAEHGGGFKNTALSSSAVCVTQGHLFIASHVEFLERILGKRTAGESLVESGDFQEVEGALNQLLAGPAAARTFVRTDESYRPTYELLRQGKMPESETLLGRLLNRLLTTPEDEDEGILRKQQIDGKQLPNFEMVRRYFSPQGAVVRSNETGWFIVGASLSKQQGPQARAGETPTAEVSSLR